MGNTNSTLWPFRRTTREVQRNPAVDETLYHFDELLKILNAAASFLPGASAVVPALRSIVGQIRKTHENSDSTARELKQNIRDLVELIKTSVEIVQKRIGTPTQSPSNERSNDTGLIEEGIKQLISDVKSFEEGLEETRRKHVLNRWFHRERRLQEVNDGLTRAKDDFMMKTGIAVGIVEHILSRMDTSEYDKDLDSLSYVNVNYEAGSNSEFVPGTRVGLLSDSWGWMNDIRTVTASKFFVIYGAAGTGKSTFAHEICNQLQRKRMLGAWFFFLHDDANRGSTAKVVPTIAYQLARSQPVFLPYIANAAREYTDKHQSESSEVQFDFELLIMDPLKKAQALSDSDSGNPIVIVLDALDEADGDLVNLLRSLKILADKHERIRILITTRPESAVVKSFDEAEVDAKSKQAVMENIPRNDADGDIRIFFKSRFESLRCGKKLLDTHPDAIDTLTKKADRLFIYARTVINYLDHKVRKVSLQRFADILSDDAGVVGMPALDILYTTILQDAFDDDAMNNRDVRLRVTAVLAGLVLDGQMIPEVLAPLMGLSEDAVIRTVEELRSVLSCDGEDLQTAVIRPHHLTFAEFLVDDKRCTNSAFHIDRRACHLDFAKACLGSLNTILHRNLCGWSNDNSSKSEEERHSLVQEFVPAHTLYASKNWTAHLVKVEQPSDPALLRGLDEFCKKNLLPWIEVRAFAGNLNEAREMLRDALSWAKEHHSLVAISRILSDAWKLVDRFGWAISSSPEHIYTTALSQAPDCSLRELYADKAYSNCLISRRDPNWGSYLYALNGDALTATFSHDGRLLVLNKKDKIEIGDSTTGRSRQTLNGWFRGAEIHPNGRSLVCASYGGVWEWDLMGDQGVIRTYELPEIDEDRDYSEVVYNADGSRIVCCGRDAGAIVVWSTGDCLQPVNRICIGPATTVETLSLDCDRDQMAALLTTRDEHVVVKYWKIDSGEEIKSLQITTDRTPRGVFAKKNTMLVTGDGGMIRVWNLKGHRAALETTIDGYGVHVLDVTRSGDVIAAGREDTIRFYDAHSGAKLAVYRGRSCRIGSLRFSPEGDRLVTTSSRDGNTYVWDTTKEALSANPPSATNGCEFTRIKFSSNGKHVAAIASGDTRVVLFDGETGDYVTALAGHAKPVAAFAFSADDSVLASVSEDGDVVLWDMRQEVKHSRTLSQPQYIYTQSHSSVDMTFNEDSSLLAIVYADCYWAFVVLIWDVSAGVELFQSEPCLGDAPHLIRFSPAGPLIHLRRVAPGKQFGIWDHATKTVEYHDYDDNVHSIFVLPFDSKCGCIVSSRTNRELFMLPSARSPRDDSSRFWFFDRPALCSRRGVLKPFDCMDVHGDRLAIGSKRGMLTLLDMSRLQDVHK